MSLNIIARPSDAAQKPADLIAKWATETVVIPAWRTSTGLTDGRKSPFRQGDRVAMILQQEPGNGDKFDHLRADLLSRMENFAPDERVPGFQWGPIDGDREEFLFTIVGIYELIGETPHGDGWTDVHFRLVSTEAVPA